MRRSGPAVRDRVLGGVSCLVVGDGPPLTVLPGLGAEQGNPSGWERWRLVQSVRPLTAEFTVYVIGRGPGLPASATMHDLAADVAAGSATSSRCRSTCWASPRAGFSPSSSRPIIPV